MTSLVAVHLRDGRVFKDQADFAKGSPADPMTFEEVAGKFRGCAAFAHWPKDKTEKLIEVVGKLEQSSDVRELSALLRSAG
jgi:2-methylcitrate dehydratase PrpD